MRLERGSGPFGAGRHERDECHHPLIRVIAAQLPGRLNSCSLRWGKHSHRVRGREQLGPEPLQDFGEDSARNRIRAVSVDRNGWPRHRAGQRPLQQLSISATGSA
jgi:hypothetical protein